MKLIRYLGSTAFAAGLFVIVFIAIPWHLGQEEPPTPWWVAAAVLCVLGGILVVLITVALEMALSRKPKFDEELSGAEKTGIQLATTPELPKEKVREVIGVVQGHTVYAIWLGKDLASILRLILGGELTEYTDMMGKAREVATQRMLQNAKAMGADAVVNVRYMTTSVIASAAELLVYGTAVRLK